MRRPRSPTSPSISLFPFLAMLICVMGVMMLLLVIINRPMAGAMVTDDGSGGTGDSAGSGGPASDGGKLAEVKEALDWRIAQLQTSRDKTMADLANERLRLASVENTTHELGRQWNQLENAARELQQVGAARGDSRRVTEAERDRLKIVLAQTHDEIQKAAQAARRRPPAYAIVPFDGPNGTRRRPIYIECRGDGVVLQPEGIVLNPADFKGPSGPGNPLASTLRATRDYLTGGSASGVGPQGAPYPLLLVRPSGIGAFYLAREAMASWASEFGYELIETDWKLEFPPPDPQLALIEQQALAEARARYAWYAQTHTAHEEASPSRPTYRVLPGGGGVVREGGPSLAEDDPSSSFDGDSSSSPNGQRGGGAGSASNAGGSGGWPTAGRVGGSGSAGGNGGFGGNGGPGGNGNGGPGDLGLGGGGNAYVGDPIRPGYPGASGGASGGGVAGSSGGPGSGGGNGNGGTGLTGVNGGAPGGGMYVGGSGNAGSGVGGTGSSNGTASGAGTFAGNANPISGTGNGTGATTNGNPGGAGAMAGGAPGGTPGGSAGMNSGGVAAGASGGGTPEGGFAGGGNAGGAGDSSGGGTPGGSPLSGGGSGMPSSSGNSSGGLGGVSMNMNASPDPAPGADHSGYSPPGAVPFVAKPGEYVDSQDFAHPRPKPDDAADDHPKQSMAAKRGRNWSLPSTAGSSVPVTRPIRIECRGDRLIIEPDPGNADSKTISLKPRTEDSVDQLVAAVWDHTKGWGIAGRRMYWRPELILERGPSGEGRIVELQTLLADSGIEVHRKSP